jgi:hypothetical protein
VESGDTYGQFHAPATSLPAKDPQVSIGEEAVVKRNTPDSSGIEPCHPAHSSNTIQEIIIKKMMLRTISRKVFCNICNRTQHNTEKYDD